MIRKDFSTFRVEHAELRQMGQLGILGRYPFHWHMAGQLVAGDSYASNNSIHHTFQVGGGQCLSLPSAASPATDPLGARSRTMLPTSTLDTATSSRMAWRRTLIPTIVPLRAAGAPYVFGRGFAWNVGWGSE